METAQISERDVMLQKIVVGQHVIQQALHSGAIRLRSNSESLFILLPLGPFFHTEFWIYIQAKGYKNDMAKKNMA